ncbi:NADPH:quinone reductase [Purpureocillium takamizusanense]|uniref:NADPH:quinone reductase n=1 Tax=Purpureocillium takamizusanense TaxID=2060973 RepID=A0A9Q8Q5T0_9HYPO|nr:NADPH:quinone reductase [Purpureocillium takamizusanense]UNI13302.1 NADPH:quinone reductase [Purpureocillium takamizusanense]
MKAVQILGDKSAPSVVLNDNMPQPTATGSDILIRVHAAGVTADEVSWPEVYNTRNRIPGHDISGVVSALGPSYAGPLAVGDDVFAMLAADASQGGQAEYAVASPAEVTRKPAAISHAQAAALPIPALTAWEAIFQHAKLEKGARVLVTGASGAVGVQLVQLAKQLLGAEVIALASSRNHSFVEELGASRVVDYNATDWEDAVDSVDAVFDTVGGETLAKASKTVRDGGAVVTVADPPPPWASGKAKPELSEAKPHVNWVYFVVTASGENLGKVAELLQTGSVKPLKVTEFPIDKAVEAWEFGRQRGRSGKVVITFVS